MSSLPTVAPAASLTPPAAPKMSVDPQVVEAYALRVSAMYRAYAPDKLSGVRALLSKYEHCLAGLMDALVQKYGPEPPSAAANPSCETIDDVIMQHVAVE